MFWDVLGTWVQPQTEASPVLTLVKTEIPRPCPPWSLNTKAAQKWKPNPGNLCCHVTICTIYMVCHGNLAALAPFCVPFCWSYVLYRLLYNHFEPLFWKPCFLDTLLFHVLSVAMGQKIGSALKIMQSSHDAHPTLSSPPGWHETFLSSGIPTRKTFICYTASWLRGSETKKKRNQSAVGATGATTVHQIVTRIKNLLTIKKRNAPLQK